MSDDPNTDKLDLEEWEPQLPSADFAERVLAQVRAESKDANASSATADVTRGRSKARRWGAAAGVAPNPQSTNARGWVMPGCRRLS